MDHLEKEFLKGSYTPFSNISPAESPSTPKRKRHKIGTGTIMHVSGYNSIIVQNTTGPKGKENLPEGKGKGQSKGKRQRKRKEDKQGKQRKTPG